MKLTPEYIKLFSEIVQTKAGQANAKTRERTYYDDYYQAGWLGVMDALKRFKPYKGSSIRAYVAIRVSGAICDYQREQDKLPRNDRMRVKKIEEVKERMQREGITPNITKICKELNIKPHHYQFALYLNHAFCSDVEYNTVEDNKTDNPREIMGNSQILEKALAVLNDKERDIIEKRFVDDMTLKELGELYGITDSGMCLSISAIILKMKGALKIR